MVCVCFMKPQSNDKETNKLYIQNSKNTIFELQRLTMLLDVGNNYFHPTT